MRKGNQSLGAMIRKVNDYEYFKLEQLSRLTPPIIQPQDAHRLKQVMDSMQLPFHRHASWQLRRASLLKGGETVMRQKMSTNFSTKALLRINSSQLCVWRNEVTRSTSEWHRRMTAENLSQTGKLVNLANMPIIGSEAYIYKSPSQQEAIRKGRRANHIDHYIGPGRIVRHIESRDQIVKIQALPTVPQYTNRHKKQTRQ